MSLVTSAATQAKKDVRWNAADYAANSAAQQIWARELIAQLDLRGDEHILDVGCGDGKVTAELARAVPKGSVSGIDASPEMIRFARKTFPPGKIPNLEFQVMDARELGGCDAASRTSARRAHAVKKSGDGGVAAMPLFDIVYSSSVLHWVDDHPAFLRGAAAVLRSGGRLVVSCGGKGNAQDVFVALRPEMRLKPWRKFFRKMEKPYFFHSPADYEKWLPRFGFKTRSVKLSPKDAVYPGRDRFAAWFRTTWLPYTQRVPEIVTQASCLSVSSPRQNRTGGTPVPPANLREEFTAGVVDRYLAKHPPDAEGCVHVRMVRLEIDAVKM